MAEGQDRQEWLRRMSCCSSEPPCPTCPLLPENRHRSLKELAEAALLEELGG